MKFFENSIISICAVFICFITITETAVICIDETSLDKLPQLGADKGHIQSIQRRNATAVDGDEDETTEFANTHTDTIVPLSTKPQQSQVTKFLQTVQDTLEKAKPWVVEIEKEAKRLEQTAKRFSVGIIRDLGKFVDRLVGGVGGNGGGSGISSATTTTTYHRETSTRSPAAPSTQNADDKMPFEEATTIAANVAEVKPADIVAAVSASAPADSDASAASISEVSAIRGDAAAAAAAVDAASDADNEISGQQDDSTLCPDGFVADVNDICLRNHK